MVSTSSNYELTLPPSLRAYPSGLHVTDAGEFKVTVPDDIKLRDGVMELREEEQVLVTARVSMQQEHSPSRVADDPCKF